MFTNRISEWFDAEETRPRFAAEEAAFVQVPIGMFLGAAQQRYVAALYRVAAERARRDLERRLAPLPGFSLN